MHWLILPRHTVCIGRWTGSSGLPLQVKKRPTKPRPRGEGRWQGHYQTFPCSIFRSKIAIVVRLNCFPKYFPLCKHSPVSTLFGFIAFPGCSFSLIPESVHLHTPQPIRDHNHEHEDTVAVCCQSSLSMSQKTSEGNWEHQHQQCFLD